jgi:hypothetical protein
MTGLVAGAALVLSLGLTGWETGKAVHYAPNVMEAVAHKRGIAVQPHMLAWSQATDADIGQTWLRVVGPVGTLDALVVDLPQDADRAALQARGILVELSWGDRWICGAGWSGRARDCAVQVIRREP